MARSYGKNALVGARKLPAALREFFYRENEEKGTEALTRRLSEPDTETWGIVLSSSETVPRRRNRANRIISRPLTWNVSHRDVSDRVSGEASESVRASNSVHDTFELVEPPSAERLPELNLPRGNWLDEALDAAALLPRATSCRGRKQTVQLPSIQATVKTRSYDERPAPDVFREVLPKRTIHISRNSSHYMTYGRIEHPVVVQRSRSIQSHTVSDHEELPAPSIQRLAADAFALLEDFKPDPAEIPETRWSSPSPSDRRSLYPGAGTRSEESLPYAQRLHRCMSIESTPESDTSESRMRNDSAISPDNEGVLGDFAWISGLLSVS